MPTQTYTVKEAAAFLREHPDTTRERLRRGGQAEGGLTGTRYTKRGPWRVTEAALNHFIQKNTR